MCINAWKATLTEPPQPRLLSQLSLLRHPHPPAVAASSAIRLHYNSWRHLFPSVRSTQTCPYLFTGSFTSLHRRYNTYCPPPTRGLRAAKSAIQSPVAAAAAAEARREYSILQHEHFETQAHSSHQHSSEVAALQHVIINHCVCVHSTPNQQDKGAILYICHLRTDSHSSPNFVHLQREFRPCSTLTQMVVAFTTQGDAGGTLHFPSPTHIRHVDATSAFKQLRRSLSRSPSKASAFRLVNSKLASPSPSSPLSPDRDTLSHRLLSATVTSHANAATSSSLTTPYHPSAKKSRQPARRASPMRISSRSRNLPPSPGRSTLAELNDQGNSTPRPSGRFSNDIENRSAIPMNENMPEPLNKPSGASANINPSVPHPMLARLEKFSNSSTTSGAKSSPLKRSDGLMNLDQGNFGNPSAKRRSLHGASFGPDFDIFDYEASFQSKIQLQNDRASKDAASALDHPTIASPFPKRTSSLRKTTLQQRHDKPLLARAKMSTDIATDAITSGQATPKNRFRMSLDNYLPPMMRDSPFSSQGSLPTASAHPLNYQSSRVSSPRQPSQVQRHPLSRTITQSSSSSSMAEDSPTHIPIRHMENRRPIVDFTKSLPVGTARPVSSGDIPTNPSSQESFVQGSFATPDNYKLAKPLPAAFMSTGLISKRNKNVEDPEISFKASKDQMPDTPCKRHSLMGSTTPAPLPELAIGKSRHIRHSFGTPSTPFNPHGGRSVNGTLGNGVSIFGSGFNAGGINRRGSFASVEGDEYSQSPSNVADSQSSAEVALSTPTKQVVTVSNKAASQRTPSNRHDLDNGFGGDSPQAENENTSVHFGTPSGSADGDSDCVMDDSPSAALKSRSHSSGPSSFAVTRSARNHKSPTPLTRTFHTAPARLKSPRSKSNTLSPASPIESLFDRLPPQTPREGVMPPDPSGLSISAQNGGPAIQPLDSMLSNSFMFPPATPTASRDSRGVFGKSRSSLGSSVNGPIVETDSSLTSRFDKVDLIGTGEFSYVYRVRDSQESKNSRGYFSLPPAHQSPGTPLPDRVWAVKKTRNAYIGPRDRHRKIQEAVVLKALKYSDHVVQLFDYWENKGHLYIQTEFCEEGSLDLFLDQVGRKARLDDFRIWKIMLELALVRFLTILELVLLVLTNL